MQSQLSRKQNKELGHDVKVVLGRHGWVLEGWLAGKSGRNHKKDVQILGTRRRKTFGSILDPRTHLAQSILTPFYNPSPYTGHPLEGMRITNALGIFLILCIAHK